MTRWVVDKHGEIAIAPRQGGRGKAVESAHQPPCSQGAKERADQPGDQGEGQQAKANELDQPAQTCHRRGQGDDRNHDSEDALVAGVPYRRGHHQLILRSGDRVQACCVLFACQRSTEGFRRPGNGPWIERLADGNRGCEIRWACGQRKAVMPDHQQLIRLGDAKSD
jgi:hypothetical protein